MSIEAQAGSSLATLSTASLRLEAGFAAQPSVLACARALQRASGCKTLASKAFDPRRFTRLTKREGHRGVLGSMTAVRSTEGHH